MRADPPHRATGFSLLEAIVALAILASAGLALFASLNGAVAMTDRASRSLQADTAVANALAWVETVNPMLAPTGEQAMGDYTLRWRAEPIEPPRDGATDFLQPGLYQLGLYRMRLELSRDGRVERELELRRVGYRQVRQPAQL